MRKQYQQVLVWKKTYQRLKKEAQKRGITIIKLIDKLLMECLIK